MSAERIQLDAAEDIRRHLERRSQLAERIERGQQLREAAQAAYEWQNRSKLRKAYDVAKGVTLGIRDTFRVARMVIFGWP